MCTRKHVHTLMFADALQDFVHITCAGQGSYSMINDVIFSNGLASRALGRRFPYDCAGRCSRMELKPFEDAVISVLDPKIMKQYVVPDSTRGNSNILDMPRAKVKHSVLCSFLLHQVFFYGHTSLKHSLFIAPFRTSRKKKYAEFYSNRKTITIRLSTTCQRLDSGRITQISSL
jgi:hypothetical protein